MTITVIVSRNPLAFASERLCIAYEADTVPLVSIIDDHFLDSAQGVMVRINGRHVPDPRGVKCLAGDFVELIGTADAPVAAALVPYLVPIFGEILAPFVASLILSAAFAYVVKAIGGSGSKDSLGQRRDAPPVYNIASATNEARQFGGIPVLLGRMRIYPDIAARPYVEFVRDALAPAPLGSASSSILYTPTYSAGTWLPYLDSATRFVDPDPYPNNASALTVNGEAVASWYDYSAGGTLTLPHGWVFDTTTGFYSRLASLENGAGFVPETPPQYTLAYSLSTETVEQTQRLTQIFCAGYGDLTITQPRIRDTLIDDPVTGQVGTYRGVLFRRAVMAANESRLVGYPTDSAFLLRDGTRWPETVVSEPGAGLKQYPGLEFDGWVERTSPDDTIQAQVDIAGRLYAVGGSGIIGNGARIAVQYRMHGGIPTWVDALPVDLYNSDTGTVRKTIAVTFPWSAEWDIRVRQETTSPTDGNHIIELDAAEFRFQRNFRAYDFMTRGQNRLGLVITASAQLNGTVDRLNVIAAAKCWRYAGGAIWDGTRPGESASWSWGETYNVADWFLYLVLGGFENSVATTGPTVGKGWFPGPHPDNGDRLFGAGLDHSQIDYASIVAWRDHCAGQLLEIGAYLTDAQAIGETLSNVAAVGRASWTWQTGRLGVVWENASDVVSALYGPANIIAGSFLVTYVSQALSDEYVASYTDSADDVFELAQVRASRPGVTKPRSTGKLDLFGVTTWQQAQRSVNLAAARTLYQRRIVTFATAPQGLHTVRGDVIALTHDLTAWAIESRVFAFGIVGGYVRTVQLLRAASWDGSTPLFASVQLPDGTMISGAMQTWTGEVDTVTVVGNWWPAAQAPGVVDQVGTVNPLAGAMLADVTPESVFLFMGPTITPGRRLRVTSVRPQSDGRIAIEAIDDDPQLWTHEHAVGPATVPESREHVAAYAADAMVAPDDAGRLWLSWRLEGTHAARLSLSVDGGPWSTYSPAIGPRVMLPPYPVGTVIHASVTPVLGPLAAGDPFPNRISATTVRYTVPAPLVDCTA
ncbi:MAG: phage tail protein [Polynucleobacter sp.]